MHTNDDTIAAVATPLGRGGIGIVRVSGELSPRLFHELFKSSSNVTEPDSHRLYHGWFVDPDTGSAVDEVLCVLMKAPRSYTREHVLEIQCHSGPAVLSRILDACIARGARLAGPGEFTLRAFLNGRIDLAQAEAVAELSAAGSQAAGHMAVSMLQGRLSGQVNEIRNAITDLLAAIEVSIDYAEEDLPGMSGTGLASRVREKILAPLDRLLAEFQRGRIFRQGAGVLIAGCPNTGKSSLLNALLCEDRAIVTPVPGTTRDPVEAELEIRGVLVKFTDTAGIRKDPDPVEEIGISRVREMCRQADLLLWLIDASRGVRQEDIEVGRLVAQAGRIPDTVLVLNKADLAGLGDESPGGSSEGKEAEKRLVDNARSAISRALGELPLAGDAVISAVTGYGLKRLEDTVASRLLAASGAVPPDTGMNARHRDVLARARRLSGSAADALAAGISPEAPAVELRQALHILGEVTGEGVTEEVLHRLFSSFCVGK